MFNFRSEANYNSLKKFFSNEWSDNETYHTIKNILISNLFNEKEVEYILQQMKEEFSEDFIQCFKTARQNFFGQDLIYVLKKLYRELECLYEIEKCIIITANAISDVEKIRLEAELKQKFKEKLEKNFVTSHQNKNLEFIYEQDKNIIGGMIIKIGQTYYDGSFKKALSNLKLIAKKDIQ